jgi:hypothetical protein
VNCLAVFLKHDPKKKSRSGMGDRAGPEWNQLFQVYKPISEFAKNDVDPASLESNLEPAFSQPNTERLHILLTYAVQPQNHLPFK